MAKRHFRKNNQQIGTNCEIGARKAYQQITVETSKRTSRLSRSYMKAYLDGSGASQFLIKKYVKHVKCHRNIFDMDKRKLQLLEKNQKLDKIYDNLRFDVGEIKKEKMILLREEEDMKKQKENHKIKVEKKKQVKKTAKRTRTTKNGFSSSTS